MFSLDQLRCFAVVADELHFGRAAERLNMTQPPLSRQIQKLERVINVRLFDRDNRHVTLTAAGHAFLTQAHKLLALADTAPDLARRISAGSAGTIRIGFTAASTYGALGALLNTISDRLPELDVDLHEMVTREQLDALANGEIDLGLARPPFDSDVVDSKVLQREPLMVAVPTGHRLTRLDRDLTADDVADEDVIMHSPTRARYFYDLVVSIVPMTNRRFVHTVSQILTMISLVAAGRGIAFVPQSADFLGVTGVEFIRLTGGRQNPVELHTIWGKESSNPALNRVLRLLNEPTMVPA